MKYWRHPGPISVGTNWAAMRVVGAVVFGLVFVFLPVPVSKFAPYGSWLFLVSIIFWGGLYVLLVVLWIKKFRARKAASAQVSEPPDRPA
jgi:protein-S-isoprenylcysteine O-methyltransferase Ste14